MSLVVSFVWHVSVPSDSEVSRVPTLVRRCRSLGALYGTFQYRATLRLVACRRLCVVVARRERCLARFGAQRLLD